jgi:hypothetical protein
LRVFVFHASIIAKTSETQNPQNPHRQGWLTDETALSQLPHAAHRCYLLEFLTGASPLGAQDTFAPQSVRCAPRDAAISGGFFWKGFFGGSSKDLWRLFGGSLEVFLRFFRGCVSRFVLGVGCGTCRSVCLCQRGVSWLCVVCDSAFLSPLFGAASMSGHFFNFAWFVYT